MLKIKVSCVNENIKESEMGRETRLTETPQKSFT